MTIMVVHHFPLFPAPVLPISEPILPAPPPQDKVSLRFCKLYSTYETDEIVGYLHKGGVFISTDSSVLE